MKLLSLSIDLVFLNSKLFEVSSSDSLEDYHKFYLCFSPYIPLIFSYVHDGARSLNLTELD
jgi:hypothetical protein